MPFPSTGCQTCKQRRIKCDEAKPTCHRCEKSQRLCVESTDTTQKCLSIHSENLYASGKMKRPRGPRSSLTLYQPNSDLPPRAVAYYLNYYLDSTRSMPTVSACMSECLVAWKASGKKSGLVDLAISSLALAIFSRTQRHPPAAREAFKAYGRLLNVARYHITQTKIRIGGSECIDECLLTVVLMGWYETSTHRLEYFNQKGAIVSKHSWSHYDGAMAILEAWIIGHSPPSIVIKQVRRGIIRLSLLRRYPLPYWMWDGHRFGERALDHDLDKILVQVVNLRYLFGNLKRNKTLQGVMSEDLKHRARELDEACQCWAGRIPSAWHYQLLTLPEACKWSRRDFFSSTIYGCTSPGYATVWIQYFITRMLILSTYLSLVKHDPLSQILDDASGKLSSMYSTQLKEMADGLAFIIPFCLGRFDFGNSDNLHASVNEPTIVLKVDEKIHPALALPTVWPISMAVGLDGVEPAQQLWFFMQLSHLGQVLGDGALMSAGTNQWNHEQMTTDATVE